MEEMKNREEKIESGEEIEKRLRALCCMVAREQNKLIKKLSQGVSVDGFASDVDLSGIGDMVLKDFWLYSTAYIVLNNKDNIIDNLTEEECDKMASGIFTLNYIENPDVVEFLAKFCLKKIAGYRNRYKLREVKDSKYYLQTGERKFQDGKLKFVNSVELVTPELDVTINDDSLDRATIDGRKLLIEIRNCIAHVAPFVDTSGKIVFLGKDMKIVASRMWLRGLFETFARNTLYQDHKKLREDLFAQCAAQGNYLESFDDVINALRNIKEYTSKITDQHFRLVNFLKERINYYDDFYKGYNFEQKADIIAAAILNNPSYTSGAFGKENPKLVYNLQQAVAKELKRRGIDESEYAKDLNQKEIAESLEELKRVNQMLKDATGKVPLFGKDRVAEEALATLKKTKAFFDKLDKESKSVTDNLEMFDLVDAKALNVEMAVELTYLLGYNSLVTSYYHELYLTNCYTEKDISPVLKKTLDKMDFSGITYRHDKSTKKENLTDMEKIYVLKTIRHSLSHNNNSYCLNSKKSKNISNIEMKFVSIDENGNERSFVTGSLGNFVNLFGSEAFFEDADEDGKRKKTACTKNIDEDQPE